MDLHTLIRRLTFDFYKWDTYTDGEVRVSPQPFLLSEEQFDELATIALAFDRLIRPTVEMYHAERRVRRFFQLPLHQRRMMGVEGERRRLGLTQWPGKGYGGIARYDMVPTVAGGWKVLEWNTDVCGGQPECLGLATLLEDEWPEARNPNALLDRLAEGLLANDGFSTPTLGVLYATGYAEDAQVACVLRELLRRRGLRVVIGAPTNLTFARDGLASLFGERVEIIYNYFPTSWFDQLPRRWVRSFLGAYLQGGFDLVTPLDQLIIQNKKISAFWHQYRTWFTAAEQALIRQYVPHTTCFEPRRARLYVEEREAIVLKKIDGRQGEEVVVGRLTTPQAWAEAAASIAREAPHAWTVQEWVDSRPVQFPQPETGQQEWMYPCIGVYVVRGQIGGVYTRLSRTPKTDYRALNVATLIRQG
ncbi:MAG: glutathionylspermidine synthase family protein [Nitrospinae bacterium]|nr:glutathionylspermidine synthase family protein [Nitrospinota bacterium]